MVITFLVCYDLAIQRRSGEGVKGVRKHHSFLFLVIDFDSYRLFAINIFTLIYISLEIIMAWDARANYLKRFQNRYVISSCSYAWQGYEMLLNNSGICAYRIMVDGDEPSQEELNAVYASAGATISVFLKGDICEILGSLKKMIVLLNAKPAKVTVLIYSQLPANWLYRTLYSLIRDKNKLRNIRVANLSHPCQDIVTAVFPPLEEAAFLERKVKDCFEKGLTSRELDSVLSFYRGVSVKAQAKACGLAIKTIYVYRKEGLRKLQLINTFLSRGALFRATFAVSGEPVSHDNAYLDGRFTTALINKEIFPVYQIITDSEKRGVGFEILLRWNRKGVILKPADFLANLHDKNIWLQLMALVIDAAVRGINKYNGKYYFSVNIPPELASGNALPGMAKKAVEMLSDEHWAEKLVFEFAETIDVTLDKGIADTMQRLRQTGCRLFLDDCFSSDHVMFPVRQIPFDGLKLDKDIVDKFAANDSDFSLIKAMQYYSDITGVACVAEGVDSEEKFNTLSAAGIKSFQGYYLARAVKEEDLDFLVRKFS